MVDFALDFLKTQGYEIVKKISAHAAQVYKIKKDNKFKTAKIGFSDGRYDSTFQPENEIRILSETNNIEGIVKMDTFYRLFNNDTRYSMVVKEFVEGKTIKEAYRSIPFGLVKRIQKIVDKIHNLGYAQLDLKPTNVVMEGENPVIIDLGNAGKESDFKNISFNESANLDNLVLLHKFA